MAAFAFHPDLFEERTRVLEALGDAGYVWLTDFSSVDLLHDLYGLEVCGIRDEDDARPILELLGRLYPLWPFRRMYFKEHGRERGWKSLIHREQEERDDRHLRG